MAKTENQIKQIINSIKEYTSFQAQYIDPDNVCFRKVVNKKYKEKLKYFQSTNPVEEIDDKKIIKKIRGKRNDQILTDFDINAIHLRAASFVHKTDLDYAKGELESCLRKNEASNINTANNKSLGTSTDTESGTIDIGGPFDRRLDRLFYSTNNEATIRIPFSTRYAESATSGFVIGEKLVDESDIKNKDEVKRKTKAELDSLKNDLFYKGIPSLQNTYSLTKLYGSEGGQKLVNKRGERKWYEVDQAIGINNMQQVGYSSNPTTSSLISWGNGDPYGRTPFHFTDFVFSKYWNKIENNRLITLRRFGAPILDNMKFPGMDGITNIGSSGVNDSEDEINPNLDSGGLEQGSTSKILFPPMASAITYFGEETGNTLNSLLRFTTGLKWGKQTANVHEVNTTSTPDHQSGPGGIFGGLSAMSRMLNIAGGNFNPQLIMNEGVLPPDPYKEGPYENRILGPVNRIDEVRKREAGLEFEWSGLNIVFEYVARPIGGINPKAILLDILSNFLVIGSATAVFFGGQHRFMGNPAKYPFLGGEKGIEAWYSGKPLEWGKSTIDSFVDGASDPDGGILKNASSFFNTLLGKGGEGGGIFGAIKNLFTDTGIASNVIRAKLAEKSSGQVPYLQGLKALLTGEPVGEWHITIGNPLNPIAMIGNLICTGVEVEFGEELGPDDFPTEIKFTVKLDHAMPRDRDAIQSIFNRGMGRIYDLPDKFIGTADGQTVVDDYTMNANETGTAALSRGWLAGPSTTGSKSGPPSIRKNVVQGNTSVWQRTSFAAISANENLAPKFNEIQRSAYRAVDWIALKSLR